MTLKVESAQTHPAPATISAGTVSHIERLSPVPTAPTTSAAEAMRMRVSVLIRARRRTVDSAPATAPTPNPPSMMP